MALVSCVWSGPAVAQPRTSALSVSTLRTRSQSLPPPALMVVRNRVSRPLRTTRVAIETTIVGHLAQTTMTMTFSNPNARVMSGDLYFPLPQGATVSGYALDIKGKLVDGVVVDKHKARRVFETEVRKGVDPGLVEWTKGQNFKTRVFPIPAKGSRTVRVSYVTELLSSTGGPVYYLPLSFRKPVEQLALRIEVVKAVAKPVIVAGGPAGLQFSKTRTAFVATAKLANARLTDDLYLHLPRADQQPVRVERSGDGALYFSIRDRLGKAAAKSPVVRKPRRIAVYWDASMSRADHDHKTERALLGRYFDRLGAVEVYLVTLRDRSDSARRFRLPAQRAALNKALTTLVYDGATSLRLRRVRRLPPVDLNLLISDGLGNYGAVGRPRFKAPVYAINTATVANHNLLRFVALTSGGAYLNLRTLKPARAAALIGRPAFSFISATVRGATQTYPATGGPVHGAFELAGKLRGRRAVVTLNYGYAGRVTRRRTFVVRAAAAAKGDLIRRHWAQKKLNELMLFPERNRERIAALGRTHGIVTPGTSLLVLERLSQYIQHEIRPPASWPSMRKRYDAHVAKRARKHRTKRASKLKKLIELWRARVAWWNTRFVLPKRGRKSGLRGGETVEMRGGHAFGRGAAMGGRRAVRPRVVIGHASVAGMRARTVRRRRLVSAPAVEQPEKSKPEPTIELEDWDPKTPYMAAIKKAPRARQYRVYLQQRKKHGQSPGFYVDVGNYFVKTQRPRLGLRILSNLAELELENAALLRVLAHRLSQLGRYHLSAQLFERVAALRPEEPQSFRDLALVLERLGDRQRWSRRKAAHYARALKLLAKVVNGSWDRFDEIELIALTELNAVYAKARRYGVGRPPVDRRLLKHLHMDVRIVMTWDADDTDMDLHVVDPAGEEAYYGNRNTKIGGLVSRDFTNGYGPEVFAIRRAMRGGYTIKAKFYGSSAAKLVGAVTLQVDVYTNYGRRNQRRKSITLRLAKEKDTFTVGAIRF